MYFWENTHRPDGWNIQKHILYKFYKTKKKREKCLAHMMKFTKYNNFMNPIEVLISMFRSYMYLDKYNEAKVAILKALKLPVVTCEVFTK